MLMDPFGPFGLSRHGCRGMGVPCSQFKRGLVFLTCCTIICTLQSSELQCNRCAKIFRVLEEEDHGLRIADRALARDSPILRFSATSPSLKFSSLDSMHLFINGGIRCLQTFDLLCKSTGFSNLAISSSLGVSEIDCWERPFAPCVSVNYPSEHCLLILSDPRMPPLWKS